MFIFVKYGHNEECMVNINCRIINLLRYLKNFPNTSGYDLDLADLTGDVKCLQDNRDKYASSLLKEKEKYVLLKIDSVLDEKTGEKTPTYTPLLLSNEQILNKDFNTRLNTSNNAKPKPAKTVISLGASLSKVAKVINPLTKNSKRNSQVQMINESENSPDD